MGARHTNRSPRGAQAEAKRRLAERIARAESALADFLEASEQIDYARQLIASYEGHQQRSLASLIDAVGREQAADLTGVDDRQIRAALAISRAPASDTASEDDAPQQEDVEPSPDGTPQDGPQGRDDPEAQAS